MRHLRRRHLALAGTVLVAAFVCTGCRSETTSVDENRINLVAADPVFDKPAPGTTEGIVSVSPAEEQIGGQFNPGQAVAVHAGTADLATARWWFTRLEETGWAVQTIGGVNCGRGSYALSANKNFDDDETRFLAGMVVIAEDGKVVVSAQIGAASTETPGGGNVGEGVELADTCLGAD